MKDTWYSDNRDLVKWGVLAHIADRDGLDLVIQVPYLRCGERPRLETSNGAVAIQVAVWDFFRNPSTVEALGARLGRRIVVISEPFEPRHRERYRDLVTRRIRELARSKVVLLDPDTGIATGKPTAVHVTVEDVQDAWQSLSAGDWLVLYQHAARRKNWRHHAQLRFAAACRVQHTELFTAPKIAWDVAFIAAKKRSG